MDTKVLTKEELDRHEKHLEDYPDAMPTYETLQRYIAQIRQLLDENESLSQRLKDYEGCKGIEDYYRVLCDLREVKAENERLKDEIEYERDSNSAIGVERELWGKEREQLKADKAVAIETLQNICDAYDGEGTDIQVAWKMVKIARTTLEQLKRE